MKKRYAALVGLVTLIMLVLPGLWGAALGTLNGLAGNSYYIQGASYDGLYPGLEHCVIRDPDGWPVDDRAFGFFQGMTYNWGMSFAAAYNRSIHEMHPAASKRNCDTKQPGVDMPHD